MVRLISHNAFARPCRRYLADTFRRQFARCRGGESRLSRQKSVLGREPACLAISSTPPVAADNGEGHSSCRAQCRYWPISLKKSVSNFEIIGPAIRRCSIANR